jgi:hypothetical protein
LDKELEKRGHRFVRYADDCNIYVRSERAGQRAMESVRAFLTRKLKLKVNESKSGVSRAGQRKFLGSRRDRQGTQTRDCAGVSGTTPPTGPGTDTKDSRGLAGEDGEGFDPLSSRLAQLLRVLPDPFDASGP